MSSTTVVIGANYGDEGKGLMTNYFASTEKADFVIRFNGGAQAGHTVVEPRGRRHVFSHFGSGTLMGVPTMLSKHFLVNPILWTQELDALNKKGCTPPQMIVDYRAEVTTPYDMMINQELERSRRKTTRHHGSCGVGINETVVRSKHDQFKLLVSSSYLDANTTLKRILNEWVPHRFDELGLDYAQHRAMFQAKVFRAKFLDQFFAMQQACRVAKPLEICGNHSVVFEGAQGLALDMNADGFPHVTPSNTGLHNVIDVCNENSRSDVSVCYVTRSYLTRHGAGELPYELPSAPYPNIQETTNVENEFQGNFRYALLDVDGLGSRITHSNAVAYERGVTIRPSLAVTCIDQLGSTGSYRFQGELVNSHQLLFATSVANSLGFSEFYESWGPTIATITKPNL